MRTARAIPIVRHRARRTGPARSPRRHRSRPVSVLQTAKALAGDPPCAAGLRLQRSRRSRLLLRDETESPPRVPGSPLRRLQLARRRLQRACRQVYPGSGLRLRARSPDARFWRRTGARPARGSRPAFVLARAPGPRRRGWLCPKAAVRAMPARLLLLCLLFRSSWLTVEGDRHVGAAGVLHRRDGRAAVAVRVGVADGVPNQERSSARAALLHRLAIQQPAGRTRATAPIRPDQQSRLGRTESRTPLQVSPMQPSGESGWECPFSRRAAARRRLCADCCFAKKRPRIRGGHGHVLFVLSRSVAPCPAGRSLGWVLGAATFGCERGQSSLSGGPSSDMSCFSKMAATTARSGVPLRVAGPSSS
jgi:hypothetical protein